MTDHDNEQKHHSIKSSATKPDVHLQRVCQITTKSSPNNEFPIKPSIFDTRKFSANRPPLSNVNPHKNDKITYKTPVQPTDKHFTVTSLFLSLKDPKTFLLKTTITNVIFADLKSKCIESFNGLQSAKEVDLQTGYPILSWFLDMYSRDRIAKAVEFDYDITGWFHAYENPFARYVLHTHPEIANKLKHGMIALVKHVLPPIKLHNIQYNIVDDLNAFASYVISSYQFIQSVLIDEWQHILPIQVDVKIIPRQVKQLGTSFGS
eukprot:743204_1